MDERNDSRGDSSAVIIVLAVVVIVLFIGGMVACGGAVFLFGANAPSQAVPIPAPIQMRSRPVDVPTQPSVPAAEPVAADTAPAETAPDEPGSNPPPDPATADD